VLLVAAITFALPYPDGWANGPALIGVWIVLSFGYFGFGQFLPALFAPIGIPVIVLLAVLYLAAGIGLFSGRRWAWPSAQPWHYLEWRRAFFKPSHFLFTISLVYLG
jgi:hypothetical protein